MTEIVRIYRLLKNVENVLAFADKCCYNVDNLINAV